MSSSPRKPAEKGGFLVGFIVGLLLGLAIALGVALYVAKVPIPFVDKVPQRSAEDDAKEAAANKDWNPNANLPGTGKPPKAAGTVGGAASTPAVSPPAAPPTSPAPTATAPAAPAAKAASVPAVAASAAGSAYVYFVQAGAFASAADAEQQRARLAMQGFNAKVYERAANEGKTIFRVRIGPFDEKKPADELLAQVQGAGLEAAVVRTLR